MKRFRSLLVAVALFMGGIAGAMSEEREQEVLAALLSGEIAEEEVFAPSFLEAVPLQQIREILAQVHAQTGAPVEIVARDGSFLVRTESHEMPVDLALDAEGRVAGLWLHPAVVTGADVTAILEQVEALADEVAYLVTRDGEALYASNEDALLAVGSTFKLAVLAELAERIATGAAAWDDVLTLETRHVSLPSGVLQGLPAGSPVTLHTLAAFMISISDNTATDALLDHLGRQPVAERLGTDFVLKTREFFVLKADATLRERFLAADADERASLVAEMDAMPLPAAAAGGLHDPGIEYYVPVTTLCRLMAEVADIDVIAINPGIARPADWDRVAYKGGSETGVLNFTSEVRDAAGTRYCVSISWNAGQAIDEAQAASLYGSLLAQLRAGGEARSFPPAVE